MKLLYGLIVMNLKKIFSRSGVVCFKIVFCFFGLILKKEVIKGNLI